MILKFYGDANEVKKNTHWGYQTRVLAVNSKATSVQKSKSKQGIRIN